MKNSQKMKKVIAILSLVLLLMGFSGCMTYSVLKSAETSMTCIYRVTEYDEAFLTEDTLVLNCQASRWGGKGKTIRLSGTYSIDPSTNLPSTIPREVTKERRNSPDGAETVNIEYQMIPSDDWQRSLSSYQQAELTVPWGTPTLIINCRASDPDFPDRVSQVNSSSCLFVDGHAEGKWRTVELESPSYSIEKTNSAELYKLPLTLVGDIVTAPFQAALLLTFYFCYDGP